jgi:hypothetical protein
VTREEALGKAAEHVQKLSTNTRGYADNTTLTQRVDATERLARFLIGEEADA